MPKLFEIAFIVFILYLLYKFVFELIVPVSKAASQVKTQMKQMHTMQQENAQKQQKSSEGPIQKEKAPSHDGDYIEFEEIK